MVAKMILSGKFILEYTTAAFFLVGFLPSLAAREKYSRFASFEMGLSSAAAVYQTQRRQTGAINAGVFSQFYFLPFVYTGLNWETDTYYRRQDSGTWTLPQTPLVDFGFTIPLSKTAFFDLSSARTALSINLRLR